jgi:hypothetical protein
MDIIQENEECHQSELAEILTHRIKTNLIQDDPNYGNLTLTLSVEEIPLQKFRLS